MDIFSRAKTHSKQEFLDYLARVELPAWAELRASRSKKRQKLEIEQDNGLQFEGCEVPWMLEAAEACPPEQKPAKPTESTPQAIKVKKGWQVSELEAVFNELEHDKDWYRGRLRKLVRSRDSIKRQALHIAAYYGNADVVKLLVAPLKDGIPAADIYAPAKGGLTALHFAAMQGHVGIVKILLNAGCRVNTATTAGKTPLEFADHAGHKEVATFLRARGGIIRSEADTEFKDLWSQLQDEKDSAAFDKGGGSDKQQALRDTALEAHQDTKDAGPAQRPESCGQHLGNSQPPAKCVKGSEGTSPSSDTADNGARH